MPDALKAEYPTKFARFAGDLYEMLRAIGWSEFGDDSVPAAFDVTCRKAIEAKFNKLPPEMQAPARKRMAELLDGRP